MLYLDDGISFAYRHGKFLRQRVACDAGHLTFAPRQGSYRPWWRAIAVSVHGWTGAAPRVSFTGRVITARVDAATATLRFTLPDVPEGGTVTIGSLK